jgi:hypothetical protein
MRICLRNIVSHYRFRKSRNVWESLPQPPSPQIVMEIFSASMLKRAGGVLDKVDCFWVVFGLSEALKVLLCWTCVRSEITGYSTSLIVFCLKVTLKVML